MTNAQLIAISKYDVCIEPRIEHCPARYAETTIPLDGLATVTAARARLLAEIINMDDWQLRMLQSMGPGEVTLSIGAPFRRSAPGRLLRPEDSGSIIPDSGGWEARGVTWVGSGSNNDPPGDLFRFGVSVLHIDGPAIGQPVAAVRVIFAGGEWAATTTFAGKRLVVSALTNAAARREDETLAATIDGELDGIELEALWLLLSFITGNTLQSLAIEFYDAQGALIGTEHRRGKTVGGSRHEFFHYHYGPVTPVGLQQLGNGINRLMRAEQPFPIENVLQHLLDASSGDIDIDTQRLVLCIHSAFEAWTRKYGRQVFIEDQPWEKLAKRLRKGHPADVWTTLPEDIRAEVKSNVAADMNHSNRTSMGWRQRLMFDDLSIDVSDEDNRRVLELRNEILHNGFFLRRWRQLTPEEQQRRRDDRERLRLLALTIVFRLTAYHGAFVNPVRLASGSIEPVSLPSDIAPPIDPPSNPWTVH